MLIAIIHGFLPFDLDAHNTLYELKKEEPLIRCVVQKFSFFLLKYLLSTLFCNKFSPWKKPNTFETKYEN